jgi:hypothetical protein
VTCAAADVAYLVPLMELQVMPMSSAVVCCVIWLLVCVEAADMAYRMAFGTSAVPFNQAYGPHCLCLYCQCGTLATFYEAAQ